MFALEKLVFACLQHFLVFRMFDIADVCPGKAGFRKFAALFGFWIFDISDVCPSKAGFSMFAALFGFSDV